MVDTKRTNITVKEGCYLHADGSLKLDGNLEVKELCIEGNLYVEGNLTCVTIEVKGDVRVTGNLKAKNLCIEGNLYVEGNLTCAINKVKGDALVTGNLKADEIYTEGNLYVKGSICCAIIVVKENLRAASINDDNMFAWPSIEVKGNCYVKLHCRLWDRSNVRGNFVAGSIEAGDNLFVGGNLDVIGDFEISADLTVEKNLTVGGNFGVSFETHVRGNLEVNGNVYNSYWEGLDEDEQALGIISVDGEFSVKGSFGDHLQIATK